MVSARIRFRELSPAARRRIVLGALAALLALLALLALGQEGRVRARMIDDATASASAAVQTVLAPELTVADASTPATGERYGALAAATQPILADGTVESVTVWAADGTVLFAGDVTLVGDQIRAMRTTVLGVVGRGPRSVLFRGLVRSFVPVELAPGVAVAVEVDRDGAPIASATDPWRLMALLAGAAVVLLGLLLARTFTRSGRRAEGFDEETLRAALAARRKAERALAESADKRELLQTELDRTRRALREAEERARETARVADDAPRLREHLALTAEDLKRVEQERDALRERLQEVGRAVEAEAARGREELADALAEIERLEGVKISLQDRAAKAEDAVAHLTKQVADLQARPDIEAELASARKHAEATRRELGEVRKRAEAAERRNAELEDLADELRTKVNDLERRPDLSAKLDAASAALDIAREQIRALTARTDEADAESVRLRAELDGVRAERSKELEQAKAELAAVRAELASTARELQAAVGENGVLRDELEALRREADAAGELAAGAKAELLQTTELVTSLRARVQEAEAQIASERASLEAELERERTELAAQTERERTQTEARIERERAEAAARADDLRRQLQRALKDKDAAIAERDEALQARKRAAAKRDALTAERDALTAERDALTAELETAQAAARAEADRLGDEAEALRAEAARLRAELELAGTAAQEGARALQDVVTDLARDRAALEQATAERERLAAQFADLEREAARARAEAAAAEATGRDELARARAEAQDLRGQVAAARAEREAAMAEVTAAHARIKEAERRVEEAEAARAEAEAAAAEATARAERADELLAESEARFHRTRFTEATGADASIGVSGPDGLAVEIRSEPSAAQVNGSATPNGSFRREARATTQKVEVDTLVRRVVQGSWSDRDRMVSVYAEPVTVEASADAIERILSSLLERSVQRTSQGNRIVVHVERSEDGVDISVEDGRPPADDPAIAETNRMAAELGGWARVEEHRGGGSTSRVHLPRSVHADATAPG